MPTRPDPAAKATFRRDVAACRAVQRKHGTSYFFATRLLPKERRWAVHALYAFFRVPDELVDTLGEGSREAAERKLEAWREEWRRVRAGGTTTDPVLRLAGRVFEEFSIPDAEAEAFFASMAMDTRVFRYETYEDVRSYMYGSAAIVGRMLARILGYVDEAAFAHAEALGYAMQWTNFLRDIDEDWRDRGRVYLPQDRLRAHGLGDADIAARAWSPRFEALMREEIARADGLYLEAEAGIRFLRSGRFGVLVASRLYRAILRRLEAQGRNPFAGRARTSFFMKIRLAAQAWRDLPTLL